jgi:hypothetical protein
MSPPAIIWTVAAVVTAGVVIRRFDWPETVWAVNGAALLLMSRLLSAGDVLVASSTAGRALAVLSGNCARSHRDTYACHRFAREIERLQR